MFTEKELYEKLSNGAEGSLQLSYEDACTLQKLLLSNGYSVLMSGGDIGGEYKVQWIYCGDTDDLNYADSDYVVFAHKDYLDMLYWKDYEIESEDE